MEFDEYVDGMHDGRVQLGEFVKVEHDRDNGDNGDYGDDGDDDDDDDDDGEQMVKDFMGHMMQEDQELVDGDCGLNDDGDDDNDGDSTGDELVTATNKHAVTMANNRRRC